MTVGDHYITLDCRDGKHGACTVCFCPCHLNVAAGSRSEPKKENTKP